MNIHVENPNPDLQSIIKIIGIGGGGGNAVNYMFSLGIKDVDFINCNTDLQALKASQINNIIQLGPQLTEGLGAGAEPEDGKKATEESIDLIKSYLEINTKMVFIAAGMGGGTGTGGSPVVAKLCKEMGLLTVAVVTKPFSFEGKEREQNALAGIESLKKHADALIVVDNEKLFEMYGDLGVSQAFAKANDVLTKATTCIVDIISKVGVINVDFNDVNTVLKNSGHAILTHAEAEGEDRALKAIEEALNSPLIYDNNIKGARHLLLNITSSEGDYNHKLSELNLIKQYIKDKTGDQISTILGVNHDNKLDKKISITLIAAGFNQLDSEDSKKKKGILEEGTMASTPDAENVKQNPSFIPIYNRQSFHTKDDVYNEKNTTQMPTTDSLFNNNNSDKADNELKESTNNDSSEGENMTFIGDEDYKKKFPDNNNEQDEEQIMKKIEEKREQDLKDLSYDAHNSSDELNNREFQPSSPATNEDDDNEGNIHYSKENTYVKNYVKGKIVD